VVLFEAFHRSLCGGLRWLLRDVVRLCRFLASNKEKEREKPVKSAHADAL
jgi:hypothetical protein